MFRFSDVEAEFESLIRERFNLVMLVSPPGEQEQHFERSLPKSGMSGAAGIRRVTPTKSKGSFTQLQVDLTLNLHLWIVNIPCLLILDMWECWTMISISMISRHCHTVLGQGLSSIQCQLPVDTDKNWYWYGCIPLVDWVLIS